MSFSQIRLSQLDPLPKIDNVKIGRTLGQGSFAMVKTGTLKNYVFAVKFIHRKICARHGLTDQDIGREVLLHKECSGHQNVIRVIQFGGDNNWLFICMELANGGDLFDKIEPDVGVDEDVAQFYFKQMISAMKFCHEKGVAHRDIKPENILLDKNYNLKLADFGLACVFKRKDGTKRRCLTPCGSPPYMAPEVVNEGGYDAEASDVWSLGAVLYVLLTGETPWDEPLISDPDYKLYVKGDGKVLTGAWGRISPFALSLLRRLMRPQVDERFTLDRALNHIWIKQENPLWGEDGMCRDPLLLARKLIENLHISLADDQLEDSQTRLYDPFESGVPISLTQPTADLAAMLNDEDEAEIAMQVPMTQQDYLERSSSTERAIKQKLANDPALLQFTKDKAQRLSDVTVGALSADRLTRFFTDENIDRVIRLLLASLSHLHVDIASSFDEYDFPTEDYFPSRGTYKLNVALRDSRRLPLRGCVTVSRVDALSFKKVEFFRTKGDPLEWRRLFKRVAVLCRDIVYVDWN